MSEQLTDHDDDVIGEDQIIIEDAAEGDVLVESDDVATPPPTAAEEDGDEDDDPDQQDADDERLGEDEEGKPKPSRSAIRRKFFREQRKREQAELAELRALAPVLMQRLAAVEGSTIETNVASVTSQIEQAQADLVAVQQAITKAVEDGDGATFAQATDLKDKITAKIAELRPVVTQLQEAKQKLVQPAAAPTPAAQPQANPAAEFERQWMAANPWFSAQGTDERSQMAKMVHSQMVQEGYSPATQTHWPELTRRLKALTAPEDKPARKGPGTPVPTGMGREHAAPGRTQVRLSAERVQAMKDAGYWDDPVLRTSMIKQYQEYDRNAGKGS